MSYTILVSIILSYPALILGFILDLNTYHWQMADIMADSNIPYSRCEHAVASLAESKFILFGGGGSENNRFKDVFIADLVDPEDPLGL